MAGRSYPTSEVRDGSQERQAATPKEQLRGLTLRPRSGAAAGKSYLTSRSGVAAAGRSYPKSEVRGGGQECQAATTQKRRGATAARGQGRQQGGATPAGAGWEEQPHVQGAVAAQAQEGLEELFHVKVRRGGGEEILLVLEKAEEPEIKLPTSAGSWKKQESSRKTSISVLLTMPKLLTVWITVNCGQF